MPAWRAMASAVLGWSPVMSITRMPARRHSATASGTPGRSGSAKASSPSIRNGSAAEPLRGHARPRIGAGPPRGPGAHARRTPAPARRAPGGAAASHPASAATASGAPLAASTPPLRPPRSERHDRKLGRERVLAKRWTAAERLPERGAAELQRGLVHRVEALARTGEGGRLGRSSARRPLPGRSTPGQRRW